MLFFSSWAGLAVGSYTSWLVVVVVLVVSSRNSFSLWPQEKKKKKMRKEGRKKREWGNTHTHIWVFLLLLSFWSGGLYSSGLLRPSRAREADLLMAAQLPPQLSVPFSLFSWLFWSLLHSFILWLFLSLLFWLLLLLPSTICPPTSVSLCALGCGRTLRIVAGRRWEMGTKI